MDDFLCCGDVGDACSVSARHPKTRWLAKNHEYRVSFSAGASRGRDRVLLTKQFPSTRAFHMSATLRGAMES